MLGDSRHSLIGCANLDNRSLQLDYELGCLIADEGFNQKLAAMLEEDMSGASPLRSQDWAGAPTYKRLLARISRLLAPLL